MLTRTVQTSGLLAILGLVVGAPQAAQAGPPSTQNLARQTVTTSANIKAGDVVVVAGGKHNIELMEAIAVEVTRLGGMPTMFLYSDKVARAKYLEKPEQYLGKPNSSPAATWWRRVR